MSYDEEVEWRVLIGELSTPNVKMKLHFRTSGTIFHMISLAQ